MGYRYTNANLINITKREFQCYQKEMITDEQAIEIQTNLFGVVDLLVKWSQTDSYIFKNWWG